MRKKVISLVTVATLLTLTITACDNNKNKANIIEESETKIETNIGKEGNDIMSYAEIESKFCSSTTIEGKAFYLAEMMVKQMMIKK